MRYCKCIILGLIALFPKIIFAQSPTPETIDITGLWKGRIYNDSTRQTYKYEIGISEEKGKLTGFSHTWYNDSARYFVVKKVKIKRTDGKIVIEDVDIVSYNYPEAPPKGVRRLHILDLQIQDSILVLTGPFSTNRTKQYSPATGNVNLQRKNDYRESSLITNLKQLKIEKQLSFVAKEEAVANVEPEKAKPAPSPLSNTPIAEKEKVKEEAVKSPGKKELAAAAKAKQKEEQAKQKEEKELAAKKIPEAPVIIPAAAEVLLRKNVLQETMYFKSDSLEISLYDNGEVDGDTVSVLLNGKIIMEKQRLTTNAIRKTIQIAPGTDSIELVMYAENLGSIAPNTGLLVVHDGKDIYEIRFSGDLQKNAAILLKRRKN
jgi:hypothetical protein